MAKFILIDHSLKDTGGHHYDYVQCIARAANEMGFETSIGANRRFRSDDLPNVRSTFRHTTYQSDSYLAGLRHLTREKVDFLSPIPDSLNAFQRMKYVWQIRRHKKRRSEFIRQFAQDCSRFFHNVSFEDGDHVFFTTVSELELIALSQFLARNPQTLQAHWHLQFHFNLFEGRTPEYEKQINVARTIRSCFEIAAAQIPYHQRHFYTTSSLLADQYLRLQVGDFEVLPYPVADAFRPPSRNEHVASAGPSEETNNQPLRFTCPGAIRREKGHIEYLQPLVNKIWDKHLSQGKMQLVIQRPPRKLVQGEKINLDLPNPEATEQAAEIVNYLPHPLPSDQYSELIRSTDCGLLFYDSRTYFSRRAGVMGELLSCGKPVIVSAGSWLAEQIKETNFSYVESIANSDSRSREIDLNEMTWSKDNVPLPGGVISFNDVRNPFELSFKLDDHESGFCVSWDWHWPRDNGVFGRLELLEEDGESTQFVQTIGHRDSRSACAFFQCAPGPRVRLRFRNAFHHSMASIKNLKIVTLDRKASNRPIGTVGIIAADEEQLPTCINEMVQHYDHYRKSAGEFAHGWYSRHEPKRTVAHLMSVEEPFGRAA